MSKKTDRETLKNRITELMKVIDPSISIKIEYNDKKNYMIVNRKTITAELGCKDLSDETLKVILLHEMGHIDSSDDKAKWYFICSSKKKDAIHAFKELRADLYVSRHYEGNISLIEKELRKSILNHNEKERYPHPNTRYAAFQDKLDYELIKGIAFDYGFTIEGLLKKMRNKGWHKDLRNFIIGLEKQYKYNNTSRLEDRILALQD